MSKPLKIGLIVVAVLVVGGWLLSGNESVQKATQLKTVEVIGNIAMRNMPDDVAGGFHKIPIERRDLAPDVYQASGIANTHLVQTDDGYVLFDSGLALQVPQQMELLKEVAEGPLTHIIVSHSHADHMGGVKFWKEDGTEIVAHKEYEEEQRYLKELEPYLHDRNRVLFPWMPEERPEIGLIAYGGVTPTITVGYDDYVFEQGGVEFVVMNTPGAEGADNISLWLPEQKILFTGDTLGPLFPQFPNIFTMRGEKVRKPVEYINTLNRFIDLDIEMLVPSHHTAITGVDNIRAALTKIRDATKYVHDETIKGMNEGKTVYELMDEIQLPPELELTQEHGKVSWAVRSIWEYYATWFHFDSPTELYTVPVRSMYPDLAEIAGVDAVVAKAQEYSDAGKPIETLHLLEVAVAGDPTNRAALELRLATLETMLETAIEGGNNYEKDYLRQQINATKEALAG